jgi:flagellar biogenesis protein FliO
MDFGAQMVAAWLVVAVLIVLLWAFRKRGFILPLATRLRKPGQRRMEVVERLVLTPHHSLHLVRLADQIILVGVAPSGCTVMQNLPAAAISGQSAPGDIR